jgi:ribosomal protein S7
LTCSVSVALRSTQRPRGDLKRVKFGKKTLFYAADLASFLPKLDAAECALISNLATNQEKRELFARLAEHLMVLASEVERAIAKGDGR